MSEIEVIKAELAIANERAAKAEAKAQGLFKKADFFMRACDAQKARAEAAEKRNTELAWQVNNMRNRAEAAEKREAALRNAVIELLAHHDADAEYIARAALEAKP